MANKVEMQLTADDREALRVLQRQMREMQKFADKAYQAGRKAGEGAKEARKQNKEAFGAGAVAELKNYVAGFLSLTAAIGVARSALRQLNEERKAAAQTAKGAEMGLSQLAQLAGGDKARLDALMNQAKQLYQEGGAPSLGAAAQVVFALESAGVKRYEDRGFFARMYGVVGDVGAMAKAAATMRTAMGTRETGGFADIVGKAFAASEYSPVSAEKLLEGAARAGAVGKQIGMTDEEVLAATAIMASATGTAEVGGTGVKALARIMLKRGVRGEGLAGRLRTLRERGLPKRAMQAYLGSEEAYAAYAVLSEQVPALERITGIVGRAEREGLGERIVGSVEQQPMLARLRERRRAESRAEIAHMESMAEEEISLETYHARLRERYATKPWWTRFGAEMDYKIGAWWGKVTNQTTEEMIGGIEKNIISNEGLVPDAIYRAVERGVRDGSRPPTLAHPDEDR